MIAEFSPAVIESLGYYVYTLADPETEKVFYVGKGHGNRVFHHLHEATHSNEANEKLDIIRAIRARGQEVRCLIHRHGLTENEAIEVEASLIDFIGLPNLSNRVHGYDNGSRGQMSINDVIARYDAPEAQIVEPVILIIINRLYRRGMDEEQLYESTRKSWRVAPTRRKPKYAFAVFNSIVRQVYTIERWYRPDDRMKRWAFEGQIAANMQHYIGTSVARYLSPGAQNPIKYVNC